MVEKYEIMRAIRDGLNSIEVERPWEVTEPVVKTKLCEIGQKLCFYACAKSVKGANCGEWLYDVTWLKYDGGKLIDASLAAECEWGEREHVYDDFQKLLLSRARVVLMIFDGHKCGSKETADWLAEKIEKFKGSRDDEDAWLLAAWEKNDNEAKSWSFRYFKIRDKAAIPYPRSSGNG